MQQRGFGDFVAKVKRARVVEGVTRIRVYLPQHVQIVMPSARSPAGFAPQDRSHRGVGAVVEPVNRLNHFSHLMRKAFDGVGGTAVGR
jgi:hypothetical protein